MTKARRVAPPAARDTAAAPASPASVAGLHAPGPQPNDYRQGGRSAADEGHDPAGTARRFYLEVSPANGRVTLTGAAAHRLARVLRLPAGATVELFDGSGSVWPAIIEQSSVTAVQFSLGAARSQAALAPITVLAALIKPTRYEWLLEKATELGAAAIVPVLCERSAVRPVEIGPSRLARWRRITIEAAEQCGRATLPALAQPTPLLEALAGWQGALLIAAEPAHGPAPPLAAVAVGIDSQGVAILVGPEGGLTAAELAAAIASGGQPVSLGALVLRAETAAIASLALLNGMRRSNAASNP